MHACLPNLQPIVKFDDFFWADEKQILRVLLMNKKH